MVQVTESLPAPAVTHNSLIPTSALAPGRRRHIDIEPATLADPDDPEAFARQTQDDWRMADVYPMGKSSLIAFKALIKALCPPAPAPQLPDLEERVSGGVRRIMPYMSVVAAKAFIVVVKILDWSPLWRFKSFRRLRSLPPERASAILEGIGNSRIHLFRQLMVIARGAVLSTYFDQDEVHEALGYKPRAWLKDRLRLRNRLVAGQQARADDRIGPHSDRVTP